MSSIEKQKQIEAMLIGIAKALDCVIQEKLGLMGFAVLIFDFYDPGISNYISNAQRDDMIQALRELADRLEQNETMPPGHGTIQ